jgi:hypothetical protein
MEQHAATRPPLHLAHHRQPGGARKPWNNANYNNKCRTPEDFGCIVGNPSLTTPMEAWARHLALDQAGSIRRSSTHTP